MRDVFDIEAVDRDTEVFEVLHATQDAYLERIVSHGQTTDWLEQDHDEWVVVLRGQALLDVADGPQVRLATGHSLTIAAGVRHRVVQTDSPTIWLAVHFPAGGRRGVGQLT